MTTLLNEISKAGLPEKFKEEIAKSALHIMHQANNKELINLDSIVKFDNIMEKKEDEKLKEAEKIFSNIKQAEKPSENDNNQEEIYL